MDQCAQFFHSRRFDTVETRLAIAVLGRYLISGPIQVLNFSYFQQDFSDTFRTVSPYP